MSQDAQELTGIQPQPLIDRLSALSFREQSRLLFQATQHLPYKQKATILGAGGSQLLQKRFLPLVLSLLYKHFIKGAIWSVIAVLLVIFCLAVAGYLLQANPGEDSTSHLHSYCLYDRVFSGRTSQSLARHSRSNQKNDLQTKILTDLADSAGA